MSNFDFPFFSASNNDSLVRYFSVLPDGALHFLTKRRDLNCLLDLVRDRTSIKPSVVYLAVTNVKSCMDELALSDPWTFLK